MVGKTCTSLGNGRRHPVRRHPLRTPAHSATHARVAHYALVVTLMAALAAALLGCARLAPRASREEPLRIASTTLPGSAAVYVARARHMFEAEGIDVTIKTYGAGRLALSAVQNGEADIALVAETPVARSVLDGNDPVVFGTLCKIDSLNLVIGRKDRGVTSAQTLSGKKVGLLPGTSADFFLHIYLVASGIDPDAVTVVPLDTETLVPSLVDGRVDAISAFPPYTIKAEDTLGSNSVVLDDPGLQVTYWNAATTRSVATHRQDSLQKFLRAIDRANEFIVTHPRDGQRIMADGSNVPIDQIRRQWDDIHWLVSLDQSLVISLEDEYRWMSGSDRAPDFLRNIEPGPMQAVDPMRVTLVEPGD